MEKNWNHFTEKNGKKIWNQFWIFLKNKMFSKFYLKYKTVLAPCIKLNIFFAKYYKLETVFA